MSGRPINMGDQDPVDRGLVTMMVNAYLRKDAVAYMVAIQLLRDRHGLPEGNSKKELGHGD
jgi:hypothetical protein